MVIRMSVFGVIRRAAYLLVGCAFATALALAASDASVVSNDPALNTDARFTQANAQRQDGSGQDAGVYLPPLAGSHSEVVGTVVSDSGSGPSDFYVGAVDEKGTKKYWKGFTDENGHFHLSVPVIGGGIVALLLFKHFDRHGQPDRGSECQISDAPVRLAGTQPVAGIPEVGPALVESATAYERGGASNGVISLHTRDIAPQQAGILVDGSARDIRTLAASDSSIVGQLNSGTSLGQRVLSVQSGSQQTNRALTVVVETHFDPMPHLRPGQVQTVRLHIDGLGKNNASVAFTVSGAAAIAEGGSHKTVPVVDGVATCTIRAQHPGQLLIQTNLEVELPQLADELPSPEANPKNSPSPNPKKSTKPGNLVIEISPEPSFIPTIPPVVGHVAPSPQPSPCEASVWGGRMEPTQGVWQDDDVFEDKKGKQIVQDPQAGGLVLDAELPMVAGRDTLLFGVKRLDDNPQQGDGIARDRNHITMTIFTNCTGLKIMRMAFTLQQPGVPDVALDTSKDIFSLPLLPPRGNNWQLVPVSLYVPEGIPYDHRFTFKPLRRYLIKAELVGTDGTTSGLKMSVRGTVNSTNLPKLIFRPMILLKGDAADIEARAKKLAASTASMIGDYYPIVPGTVTTETPQTQDISGDGTVKPLVPWYPNPTTEKQKSFNQVDMDGQVFDNFVAFSNRMEATANLANAGRVVIVLSDADYDMVDPVHHLGGVSLGVTISSKVVMVRESAGYKTVMHELTHTFPFPWSAQEMVRDCSYPGDYHNMPSVDEPRTYGVELAFGERLYLQGKPERYRVERYIPFMTSSRTLSTYIAQCTYWNLVNELTKQQDPPTLLIRGHISQAQGRTHAELYPFYQFDGYPNVTAGKPGAWNIRVNLPTGATTDYPIRSPFTLNEDERTLPSSAFAYRIPAPPPGARVELRGPGVDIVRSIGTQAPAVTIVSPVGNGPITPVNGKVHIAWSSVVAPGTRPLATVLYAAGSGPYLDQLFESSTSGFDLRIDPREHSHRVKVIVTDGSRSSDASITFATR